MSNPSDATPEAAGKTGGAVKTVSKKGNGAIGRDQVVDYLRRHPEFFSDHPELLASLEPPERDQGDGIVDFQFAMVQKLREEVSELRNLRNELLTVSRANLASQDRIHRAILALLEARNFEQFIERVTTDLAIILDLDLVSLAVEQAKDSSQAPCVHGIFCLERGTVQQIFGPKGRTLLRQCDSGDVAIYGPGAALVGSEALLRLNISGESPDALLALASRDREKFSEKNGTELLNFLARVLEICFRGWLDLETA
ncbi:MAG: DUF484 family protein [Kiloniellales bacterium]|nr:DUF484 family protein [Kiloniellales bacterium]